jgi:hypothetical protein
MIFEKTKSFGYKFKGIKEAATPNLAIKRLKAGGTPISNKGIYIAIPSNQFLKHQQNPKTVKGKMGMKTTWSKAK